MTSPSEPRSFPDLSPLEFQHTLDRSATGMLSRLEKLRPAVSLLQTFSQHVERYMHISSNVRVGPTQYPSLYKAYLKAATILDVRRLPDLYIVSDNTINAYATGVDSYIIVVNTGLLDVMNENEVTAILGHELGHVKCDHMLYNSLSGMMVRLGGPLIDQIPIPFVGDIFDISLKSSLLEWGRKAEYSADRAALLATQNLDTVTQALGKLAGRSHLYGEAMNIDALIEQARDFEEFTDENPIAKFLRVQVMMQQTHPYTSLRVREISEWAGSEHYARLLSGKYRRLGGPDPETPVLPKGLLCSRCQTVNATGYAFCQGCGTNLGNSPLVCGTCKTPVLAAYNFCPVCKADLLGVKAGLPVG